MTAGAACVLRPPGLRRDPWRSTRQGERRGPGGRGARAAPAGATVAETGWRGRCVHRLSACGQRGAQRGGCAAGAPLSWRAPAASPPASTAGDDHAAAEGQGEGAAAARLCVRAAAARGAQPGGGAVRAGARRPPGEHRRRGGAGLGRRGERGLPRGAADGWRKPRAAEAARPGARGGSHAPPRQRGLPRGVLRATTTHARALCIIPAR